MTSANKFKTKKRAKRFQQLAWGCILLFFANIAGLSIWRVNSDAAITNVFIQIMIALAFLLPIFTGLVFLFFAQAEINKLRWYKNDIRKYRTRKYFPKAMDCIDAGDIAGAIDYYNGFIPVKHDVRSYLYGILLYMSSKSDDPKRKKTGDDKIADLRKFYDPNQIVFN